LSYRGLQRFGAPAPAGVPGDGTTVQDCRAPVLGGWGWNASRWRNPTTEWRNRTRGVTRRQYGYGLDLTH